MNQKPNKTAITGEIDIDLKKKRLHKMEPLTNIMLVPEDQNLEELEVVRCL